MKTVRLLLLMLSLLVFTNISSYAYVIVPQSAEAAATYTDAASAKTLKKQAKEEMKAKKKAEKRARFLAWMQKKLADDRQLVAILLTLFVGGLGIHRLYLGSKPVIILLYLVTLGGFFGIIPLIDLIRLILGQVDHYDGNSNLFRAFQSS
ncbi:MAG: TM2 domain-containing protein [Saprospiraceae bacterium]